MKIFVAWDSELAVVDKTFATIRERPPADIALEILGADGQIATGFLDKKLRDRIEGAIGLLAVIDQPNANVGWEVGLALALGLRVALATEGPANPAWLRGTPLATALRQGGVGGGKQARALLAATHEWESAPPATRGERQLLVCPDHANGEEWRVGLEAALPGWELIDTRGWTLSKLPELLAGVGRLGLVVLPLMKGEERHGVANTVGALLAGYAEGLGVPVASFTCAKAPELADLSHRRREFDGSEPGLIAAIRAWDKSLGTRPPPDVLGPWRERVARQHANPLAYVVRMGLAAADLVPVDLEVEESGGIDGLERLGARGGRSGRLRALIEEDRANGAAPRWLVKAEPGAGKTTVLRQLVHDLAAEGKSPLFVSLAEWERGGGSVAQAALRQAGDDPALAKAIDASKDVWIFLDGFDEVRSHEAIRARVAELAAQTRAPIVVTSRAGAIEPGQAWAGFTPAALRYLTDGQQSELIGKLLGGDQTHIQGFHQDMAERPGVAVLLRNPFLLTLAVGLHIHARRRDEPVPCDRAALLVRALDDCLKRGWGHAEPSSERKERWSPDAARVILRALSLELHRGGGEAWKRPDLSRVLNSLPGRYPAVADVYGRRGAIWKGEVFLDDVQFYAGVLGPLDGDGMDWRFLHRSLLEMLAAECLADELAAPARGRVIRELLAEKKTDKGGGPGRSGEVIALVAARLLEPGRTVEEAAEAIAHLDALVKATPDAAVRALAGVERVDAWAHLKLLLSVPPDEPWLQVGWDNDQLDAVLDAIARGDGGRLWGAVSAERSRFELGVLWYALERVETYRSGERTWSPERRAEAAARFFAACGLAAAKRPEIRGVAIPAGEFWMGSHEGVGDDNERPRLLRRVDGFRLGRTPVTVAQFRAFDPTVEGADEHPPNPDWFTARLYAAWLGGRLPTEAEWEYACRAGTDTAWSFGDDERHLGEYAWYNTNSGGRLQPVRKKRPNPWGLYDMHGNVFEWCESRFAPYGAATHRGPGRVLRGGSGLSRADWCPSAYRKWLPPVRRLLFIGFRVVLAPAPPAVGGR